MDAVISQRSLERYRGYLHVLAEVELAGRFHAKVAPSDLVQETFLHALEGLEGFRGRSEDEVLAWLRMILARTLLSALRRLHRRKRDVRRERSIEEAMRRSSARLSDFAAKGQPSPSDAAVREEIALRLGDALAQLPDDQRQALVLEHWHGLSLQEIGERMGRSRASVAGLIRRGLQRLRDGLDGCR